MGSLYKGTWRTKNYENGGTFRLTFSTDLDYEKSMISLNNTVKQKKRKFETTTQIHNVEWGELLVLHSSEIKVFLVKKENKKTWKGTFFINDKKKGKLMFQEKELRSF